MSDTNKRSRLDNIFVIYPEHLEWIIDEYLLSIPEAVTVLGLPSVQEWYNIKKFPNQPVRHFRVVQNARLYLRFPHLIQRNIPPLLPLIERTKQAFGDEVYAKRILEAVFSKAWSTIEGWLHEDVRAIDFSARRLMDLLMKLDDSEFFGYLQDATLSAYAQVKADEVNVYRDNVTEERSYSTTYLSGTKRTLEQMLDIIPPPGKRIKTSEYATPAADSSTFRTVISESRKRRAGDDETGGVIQPATTSEADSEWSEALSQAPWNKANSANK
jgi:hypothetical protein